MRYLGVDPGSKRLGLAVGGDVTGVATPLEVIPYHGIDAAADAIAAAVRRVGADAVVVGMPTDARGARTPACARSEALAAALIARGLRVELQGELLTTDEARRRGREAGLGRGAAVDHLAAQVLLEEFLASR